MKTVATTTPSRKQLKTCLNCGHDGPELQGEHGQALFVCPCCGQDLYARPPRSYAEMEGLNEEHSGLFATGIWRTAPDGQTGGALAPFAGLVKLVRRMFGAR